MRLQRWISMGLRGKVVRRVGFPLHMKLQSKRSYSCARGLNEESGSEGWIDIFTGGCRLSAVRPLLVSLYSTVTDRNWRRKEKTVDFNLFFLLWISAIVHHRQSHVSTADGRPGLSLCVQCFLTSSCAVAAVNSHSLQVQHSQQLRGAIDTSHFLHYSVSPFTPKSDYFFYFFFKYTYKYICHCETSLICSSYTEISSHKCSQKSCKHCSLPFESRWWGLCWLNSEPTRLTHRIVVSASARNGSVFFFRQAISLCTRCLIVCRLFRCVSLYRSHCK